MKRDIRINEQLVRYSAVVGETFVPGAEGTDAAASMVTVAYLRNDVRNTARRPVIFLFNGGPGASSIPLQGGLAPRVRSTSSLADDVYVDNPSSVLDAADLVFVDPIGTGFSRALPGKDEAQFWTTRNDAQSVRYLMQAWLKANGREASPRYIVGESYGTARAGHIAEIGADLNLDGIVLVSSTGAPQEGSDLGYAMSFPTLAVAAAYHRKGRGAGQSAQRVFDDNVAFAQGRYLNALVQGDELVPAERDALASEISSRLGLSKALVLEQNLRLGNYPFMLNLLKADGLRTGQLDARAKGLLEVFAKRHPPYDDPSMTLGTKGALNTPMKPAGNSVHKAFLTSQTGYRTELDYIGLNLKMLFAFRHDVDFDWVPARPIAALMRAQPRLRLLLTGGIYDITTPFQAARYGLAHAGVPRERTSVISFAAGHEVYDAGNVAAFNQAIRDFITPRAK